MTAQPDGGPLFAPAGTTDINGNDLGMTLRDWFAGQAMTLLPPPKEYVGTAETDASYASFAARAYNMGAAMLAERAKR